MGCGCKNKAQQAQQAQQTQQTSNTQQVQEAINKTVEKYYQQKKK